MTRVLRHSIAAIILVAFGAPPLRADTLTDAAARLKARQYASALSKVNAYYSAGGARRYRADFIRAASECRLYYNNSRLKALQVDYLLPSAAAAEVSSWITSCKPPPPKVATSNGVSSITSGLTSEPTANSADSGPEPRPLPRMSPIILRTGYIGDDYAWPTLASAEACRQVCRMQAPCRSMTYDLNTKKCWLKRSVPGVGHGDNFVASFKYPN